MEIALSDEHGCLIVGHCLDALRMLPDACVDCVVTSPPYWGLRDYGDPGQPWAEVRYLPLPGMPEIVVPEQVTALGQEPDPYHFVGHLVAVFREVRRVLKPTGTAWANMGDSYITRGSSARAEGRAGYGADERERRYNRPEGTKNKDLAGIPWLLAFALRTDGWYLRSDIIWAKPNPMPESVNDRPAKAHEYFFLLAKSERYHYNHEAVLEPCNVGAVVRVGGSRKAVAMQSGGEPKAYNTPTGKNGRNRRTVWTVAARPYKGSHFAVMPPGLIEPAILAGCPEGGTVLDPFMGAATVGIVAEALGRRWIGTEQSPDYAALAVARVHDERETRASKKTGKPPKLQRVRVEDWPSAVIDEACAWAALEPPDGPDTWTSAECRAYVPAGAESEAEALYRASYAAERLRLAAKAPASEAPAA